MSPPPDPHQVADGVFAFTGTEVNWVVLQDGTDLTLIDAGWAGDARAVERSIRSLGRTPSDLRAVLLTHAHADHTGALAHLHEAYGVPVYMAAAEVPNATGERVESAGPRDLARLVRGPRAARWAVQVVRVGGLRHRVTPAAQAFPDAGRLDLPGGPVPVATPGHTSGHTAYLLPQTGAVVTGDALITAHPTSSDVGPQLISACFAHDQDAAVASLDVLRGLDADVVLPGHGPVWRGAIADATAEALDRTHRSPSLWSRALGRG